MNFLKQYLFAIQNSEVLPKFELVAKPKDFARVPMALMRR